MDLTQLAGEIEARYRRYLQTTFYFKDPELRQSFEAALSSGKLSKGPYIEATPVFEPASLAPSDLFTQLLGFSPDAGFLAALRKPSRLHSHQESAIRAVHAGRNAVVATGTGSGKTEAFLYPILLHLYQEFRRGQRKPGVRALILYPMNALANDQRERLGKIAEHLAGERSHFSFTFGQYTGQTPEDLNDRNRRAREWIDQRMPGEFVLRSEMREKPPDILLTNYSMLEYLLLRPKDSPLFDNDRARWWRFIVLDEAHQYRGARGIEMAMLIRRVKQRLIEGGAQEDFRCIATSATLADGESDRTAAASFAAQLFGEHFEEADIITGRTVAIPEFSTYCLEPGDFGVLSNAVNASAVSGELSSLAERVGIPPSTGRDCQTLAFSILTQDARATKLRRMIMGAPTEFGTAADQTFPELPSEEQHAALRSLVDALVGARNPETDGPIASIRYHLFLRSLEGAFVSYLPEKRVSLDRESSAQGHIQLEVALCRECGQHYFVTQRDFRGGRLAEPLRDPSDPEFGATYLRPLDDDERPEGEVFSLCLRCGEAWQGALHCGHTEALRVVREQPPEDDDKGDQIRRCGACGYTAAGRDPVRELVHGADGPNAVIATTLHQMLPESRRKVLAFADGRQEAAFFAWYLEDSYRDLLERNLLLRVIRSFERFPDDGLSFQTVIDRAFRDFRDGLRLRKADRELDVRKNIWRAIYREFLSDEQRLSLEGVGLVRWSLAVPSGFKVPEVMLTPPWSFTSRQAQDVARVLFETARVDRAVELRPEADVTLNWRDLGLLGTQRRWRIGPPRGASSEIAWDGGRRLRWLVKHLIARDLDKETAKQHAQDLLRLMWEEMRRSDATTADRERLLLSANAGTRILNPDWWSLFRIGREDALVRCDVCGRLQSAPAGLVCLRHNCPGRLEEATSDGLSANHYRRLYEAELPAKFRVEEHTAQLTHDLAGEFQREFKAGRIHLLSCSTTFELGVDLGDLDTVFLRNVPPEAFNYTQRVGRAGRRVGHPGFAITYCRRTAHDRYHFTEPERMLQGRSRPPMLSISNEKIVVRHMAALALSRFFRDSEGRFKSVAEFVRDWQDPAAALDVREYLLRHESEIKTTLRTIVPPDLAGRVGLENQGWVDLIASQENSRLSQAEIEIVKDYRAVRGLEREASAAGDYRLAAWAQNRARTIAGEDVISFLSRKAVVPKYGFPVDVVELDLQRSTQSRAEGGVVLQRDLSVAIAEFAPTSRLIANKQEWRSYGLKRVPEREWERWRYVRCSICNRFERLPYADPRHLERCHDQMIEAIAIEPKFGFVAPRDRPQVPHGRTARVFSTRPYFAGSAGQPGREVDFGAVVLSGASPGTMVVLCEGRRGMRFYVCDKCGASFTAYRDGHDTPFGTPCPAHLSTPAVALGHSFITDVLQVRFSSQPGGKPNRTRLSYSLAYALLEGASEVLEVPPNDLNVAVASAYDPESPVLPIVLYDNVPGGAGLVKQLEDECTLQECFQTALERVGGKCGCAEDASCYGCLRSYRNQFAHRHLTRGPVQAYLAAVLRKWP